MAETGLVHLRCDGRVALESVGMGGFLSGLRAWSLHRSFEKKMREAKGWPTPQGEVNGWKIVTPEAEAAFGVDSQIEAGFHFIVNDEYFGGYVRSEPMVRREAERMAQGSPRIMSVMIRRIRTGTLCCRRITGESSVCDLYGAEGWVGSSYFGGEPCLIDTQAYKCGFD